MATKKHIRLVKTKAPPAKSQFQKRVEKFEKSIHKTEDVLSYHDVQGGIESLRIFPPKSFSLASASLGRDKWVTIQQDVAETYPPGNEWVLVYKKGAVGPLTARLLFVQQGKPSVIVNQGNERIEITHWRHLNSGDWPDPEYHGTESRGPS